MKFEKSYFNPTKTNSVENYNLNAMHNFYFLSDIAAPFIANENKLFIALQALI